VMVNRAEAQVSWASRLRQLGDQLALAERWKTWGAVVAQSGIYGMPAPWLTELGALGQLMAAISGVEAEESVGRMLAQLRAQGRDDPRAVGHLELAGALAAVRAGRSRPWIGRPSPSFTIWLCT
jgi:hypothetical protein